MTLRPDAASLLRSVGLLADGPTVWGRPVPAQGPGVFVIELPEPKATAPVELTRVGKWIERVDTLRLDGERPSSRALAARLAAFWLPSQTVLYIGATDASIGRRVAAIARTELGDRRPHSGGHWLKTLRSLEGVRVWWTLTDATEEYEDALLAAFAAGIDPAQRTALPDRDVVLPWANLRRPTGERKATGLSGSLLVDPTAEAPAKPTFVVEVPDGDADGANGEPPTPRRRAAPARPKAPRATPAPRAGAGSATGGQGSTPIEAPPVLVAEALTAEGAERLRAELDELTQVRRREVIARIRTAKEHGDLKENSDYHAAREEQSFLEGRVQAIEARLRSAVIVDAPAAGSRVGLGSVVTLDDDGEEVTYTIVGADESDPKRGRISSSSPVGRALVGHDVGDFVPVQTPAGERRYRILGIA
jgi:transcription elongation factor GreA